MFHLLMIGQVQLDFQHLYIIRRANTRVRSELIAAIYDKALKRKDYANVSHPDSETTTARADVGKIVNLMSGDANTVGFPTMC